MNIQELSRNDQYKVYRYLYTLGISPITDVEFDTLEKEIKALPQNESMTDLFSQTSDDDDMPTELLRKVCSEEELKYILSKANEGKKSEGLIDFVSKSMHSENTLEGCFAWIDNLKREGVEFCVSPKIDGTNTTSEFQSISTGQSALLNTRTRGRSGNAFDITAATRRVLPATVECDGIIVAAEAVVRNKDVETYNQFLGITVEEEKLKTPRGVALSALRRQDIPPEAIDLVSLLVFRVNYGATHSEGLDKARELGFTTVPYEVYKFKYTTRDEFESELTKLIWKYRNLMDENDYITDGIVLQVNDNAYFQGTVTNTAFDGGNLAVKALAWEPGVYTSTVEKISMSADALYEYNCKALIKTVYTESGKKLSWVNLYNPDTMIRMDIHEGSLIEFNYQNETTINILRNLSKEV